MTIKVLYVCPLAHSFFHPRSRAVRETAALRQAGIKVFLCTFRGIPGEELPQDLVQKTVINSRWGFLLKFCLMLENAGQAGDYLAGFFEKLSTLLLALNLKKSLDYEIIYFRDGDFLLFQPFVLGLLWPRRRWAISVIATQSVHPPNKWMNKLVNASFWQPVFRLALVKNAYLLFCENNAVKQLLVNEYVKGFLKDRVRLLEPPVIPPAKKLSRAEARVELGLDGAQTMVLHFGVLHQGKDIETVLAAVTKLEKITFVHVGYVEPWLDLAAMIERHGLNGRIKTIEKYVSEDVKQQYFAAADVIVLSYKKEFIQNVSMLFEAAASALPVIASDGGEMAQLVGHYSLGLTFKAGDSDSLLTALQQFTGYSNAEKEKFSQNSARFREEFSNERWVRECLKMLNELRNETWVKT